MDRLNPRNHRTETTNQEFMGTQASSQNEDQWPGLPPSKRDVEVRETPREKRSIAIDEDSKHRPAIKPRKWSEVFTFEGREPQTRRRLPPAPESPPAEVPIAPKVVSVEEYKDLDAKYLKAEATAIEKEAQVYELQKTIMHLNRRDGEASKDDGYFATQFTAIENSIVEWVLTYFRGGGLLSPEIRDELRPYAETGLLKSKTNRIKVLSGIIADVFMSRIFGCFLFGAPGGGKEFKVIQDQLRGTDYHIQRWRALTVNLFTQSDGFKAQLAESIEATAKYLEVLLATFVPKESDEARRNDSLRKLVREAAALSLEVRGQSDVIELHSVERGHLYKASHMEDMNCMYEEFELETEGATVQLQVFPVVFRRGYDGDGNFWERPCMIKKANVLASVA